MEPDKFDAIRQNNLTEWTAPLMSVLSAIGMVQWNDHREAILARKHLMDAVDELTRGLLRVMGRAEG